MTEVRSPPGRPRRICLVLLSDDWGGAELHTLALTAVLASRGHRCVILELNDPVVARHGDRVPTGVDVLGFGAPAAAGPGFRDAYRCLRGVGADVGVFAKSVPKVGSLQLDMALRMAFAGRFLTVEHSTPPPRGEKKVGRHLGGMVPGLGLYWYRAGLEVYVRSLFPRRIVTVSRAIAEELVRGYRFPPHKMVPIPNGIDPERFKPDPEARVRARRTWGIPSDAIVFGSVGRLSIPDKGLDISIDLFARLCAAHSERPLWYVLVGQGRYEERLRKAAAETGFGSRILFAGPTDSPWEAYSGMDILLMPSRYEGIGFALLEAMATGCVPVAMGAGGVRDVLTDPDLGRMAPAGDREAFYEGMEDLLVLTPDERSRMGRQARAHIEEHFHASQQYGKLADLIERI